MTFILGLWALSRMKSCKILNQLSLSDAGADIDDCFLSALAENGVLGNFTKAVILISSVKDFYVPYYSTRLEVSAKARTDLRVGPTIVKMAADTLSQIDATRLIRIVIDNNIDESKTKRLDNITGRAAHSKSTVHIAFPANNIYCSFVLGKCNGSRGNTFRDMSISLAVRSEYHLLHGI